MDSWRLDLKLAFFVLLVTKKKKKVILVKWLGNFSLIISALYWYILIKWVALVTNWTVLMENSLKGVVPKNSYHSSVKVSGFLWTEFGPGYLTRRWWSMGYRGHLLKLYLRNKYVFFLSYVLSWRAGRELIKIVGSKNPQTYLDIETGCPHIFDTWHFLKALGYLIQFS